MNSDKLVNLKLKLLQHKTQRFNKENISKLRSHAELIFALKKKYPIFFNIIMEYNINNFYQLFLTVYCLEIMNHFQLE